MNIAVAGVEDVGDSQFVLVTHGADETHDFRQFASRHDAVLRDVVGAQATDRTEGAFAAFPQGGALGIVLGQAHFAGVVLAANLLDPLGLLLHALGQAVQLDDQHRAGIEREAEVIRLLKRLRDKLIHHLQCSWHNPRGNNAAHRLAGLVHTFENTEEGLERRRRFHEANQHPRHDTEHPLRADRRAAQIEPGHLLAAIGFNAQPFDCAVRQYHLVAEHVVACDAVFQRVRPAGVGGDVTADRAGRLARGIRRVKQSVRRRVTGDPRVDAAGLDECPAVARIDV